MNHVIVLFNGYSYFESHSEPPVMKANASCVLIKGENCNVIVDTMTSWDGEMLLRELKLHHVKPEEINFVISTHGHSDHIGNNNLFLNAIHIVGTCVSDKHVYFVHDFSKESYKISDDIEVIATPGHTLSCVSIVIRNTNLLDHSGNSGSTCVLAGDLFEKEEDVMDSYLWIDAGSEDPSAQRKNRLKVAKIADWIVPGHGPIFKVTEEVIKKLEEDSREKGI